MPPKEEPLSLQRKNMGYCVNVNGNHSIEEHLISVFVLNHVYICIILKLGGRNAQVYILPGSSV